MWLLEYHHSECICHYPVKTTKQNKIRTQKPFSRFETGKFNPRNRLQGWWKNWEVNKVNMRRHEDQAQEQAFLFLGSSLIAEGTFQGSGTGIIWWKLKHSGSFWREPQKYVATISASAWGWRKGGTPWLLLSFPLTVVKADWRQLLKQSGQCCLQGMTWEETCSQPQPRNSQ